MSNVFPVSGKGLAGRTASSAGHQRFWRGHRLRALRHGAWLVAFVAAVISVGLVATGSLGLDAHAYFSAWTNHLYSAAPEQRGAYLYSPVFAQAIWPLTLLSWPLFCAIWLGAIAAIYAWLLAPLPLKWRVPFFLACSMDITTGNVWSFFALVAVTGLSYPAAWTFPILTKLTPVVGPVWFLARREWRQLGIVCGAVIGLAAISFSFEPGLWHEWFRLLVHPGSLSNPQRGNLRPLFYPRTSFLLLAELPIAFGITIYAARTDTRWLLPVAMIFANPVFTANSFVLLAAIPRLKRASDNNRVSCVGVTDVPAKS
ncbi:MAG TPA: glycosyltransferase family 87 protein [Gaiellaceae bacterium]|jgi:hypothetical protein